MNSEADDSKPESKNQEDNIIDLYRRINSLVKTNIDLGNKVLYLECKLQEKTSAYNSIVEELEKSTNDDVISILKGLEL